MTKYLFKTGTAIIALFFVIACNTTKEKSKNKTENTTIKMSSSASEMIAVATNKTDGNSVVVFEAKNGVLTKKGEYATGGTGTGNVEIFDWGYDVTHPLKDGVDPLIAAYAVFKSHDNKNVLVANPGDGTISSLKIMENKELKLVSTKPAGAEHPLSIASYKNLVYVASAGSRVDNPTPPPFTGNLKGFTIDANGNLTEIPNSTRELNARPTCTAFTSDGKYLVVVELVTGFVKVYGVNTNGSLTKDPISQAACPKDTAERWLAIPVGFDIVNKEDKYVVLVSEARFLDSKGNLRMEKDKVPQSPLYSWQTGSTSSFVIDKEGQISLKSGDVLTGEEIEGGEIANCWVEASNDGNTLWAANALSSSLTSYEIKNDGELVVKDIQAYKDHSESLFFGDLSTSKDGKYLYQLLGNKGEIMVFKINKDGTLKKMGTYKGMPSVGSFGLIVI